MPTSDSRSESIDTNECLRLIRIRSLGRVALSIAALPTIVALPYGVIGERVVLDVDSAALFAALSDNVVAFEVDEFDHDVAHGWSVVVVGRCLAAPPLPTEAPALGRGRAPNWRMGISLDQVSGRRTFGHGLAGVSR